MKNEKGLFLVSTYLVLSLIGTFSLAVFLRSVTAQRTVERTVNQIRAFHLAESGLDQAVSEFRKNSVYNGAGYTAFGAHGGYDVAVTTPDPVLNPKMRRITVTGHAPVNSKAAYAYAQRQVVAHVEVNPLSSCTYSEAIGGLRHVYVTGNSLVDSYLSTAGSYVPGGSDAVVGTEATRKRRVEFRGTGRVGGDIRVGLGGNPKEVVRLKGNVKLTGSMFSAQGAGGCPAPRVPTALNSSGQLRLRHGDTLTLPSGNYLFDRISIRGGKLILLGPTTLYSKGKVEISNGTVNEGGLPQNLIIKVPKSQRVKLTGNTQFVGVIDARRSYVTMSGNGQLFGAVEANHYHQHGNGKVHYDLALKNLPMGSELGAKVKMRSWQET